MANSQVHTGFWIDHSRDPVLGATVTLEAQWGTYLISAAAIVVQFAGIALWSITSYIIHQRRSKPGLRDEFDAQLQVLLRNNPAADSAAWSIWELGKTWRGRRPGALGRAASLALLPALIWSSFVVAGVLVGLAASASYSRAIVLVEPSACGFILPRQNERSFSGFNNVNINVSTNAKQYARSCYSGGGSISPISCSVYPVAALEYDTTADQPCPIPGNGDACFPSGDTGAPMSLKTRVLDSHTDLGINAPAGERVTMQYQATCAPLRYSFVDNFVEKTRFTADDPAYNVAPSNSTLDNYMFGPNSGFNYTFVNAPIIRQWGLGNLGYTVSAAISYAPHQDSPLASWVPVAPFNQTHGDLSLFAMSPNSIAFSEPVQDPVFRTFETQDRFIAGPTSYVPTQSVYVLACSSSLNFCNSQNGKCTGWDTIISLSDFNYWAKTLDLNEQQNATYYRLISAGEYITMQSAVHGVPDPLLASNNLITPSASRPVPNGQWRIEVEGWFQTVLAKLQFLPTIFVQVPMSVMEGSDVDFLSAGNLSQALGRQCTKQRVAAPPNIQSYNLFALVFIAFCGLLFPVIAITLRSYSHKLPGFNPKDHRYLSFCADDMMQLHRMALEGAGYGGWEGGTQDLPRTSRTQKRIPQADLEHDEGVEKPLLRYPTSASLVEDAHGADRVAKEESKDSDGSVGH